VNSLNGWGLTIVDSLDTMMLMGLDAEVGRAMEFIKTLNFYKHHVSITLLHLLPDSLTNGRTLSIGRIHQLL
jgi:hypothetical protein